MAAGDNTYFDNEGKALAVDLTSTVAKGQVIYADGWLGIASDDGVSGDTIELNIDERAYQLTVPASLSVAKGAEIWIDVTDLTGHIPDETAYYTATGSDRVRMFKAMEAKDANNVVIVKMLQQ